MSWPTAPLCWELKKNPLHLLQVSEAACGFDARQIQEDGTQLVRINTFHTSEALTEYLGCSQGSATSLSDSVDVDQVWHSVPAAAMCHTCEGKA